MEAVEKTPVKITENSLLPLSVVAFVISCVIGGAVWMTNLYAQTAQNTAAIQQLSKQQELYNDNLQKIANDLSEIKGFLSERRRHE